MLYKVAVAMTCCFNGSKRDTAKMCSQTAKGVECNSRAALKGLSLSMYISCARCCRSAKPQGAMPPGLVTHGCCLIMAQQVQSRRGPDEEAQGFKNIQTILG